MLKVFLGLVMSVGVLLLGAYIPQFAPQVYATSAGVLITQIQAGGVGAATKEFVVIYNNSPDIIDISGWCLTNKNNVMIVCFGAGTTGQGLHLPGYTHAIAASTEMTATLLPGKVTSTYIPSSQNSGSIAGSSDRISLIDRSGTIVDQQFWNSSISAGLQFERRHSTAMPVFYQDTDTATDWVINPVGELPNNEAEVDMTATDPCLDSVGVQIIIPTVNIPNKDEGCITQAMLHLDVTELLPNAHGSDEGREFIEIYNPNDQSLLLSNYTLSVGPQYDNTYTFPEGIVIQSHTFLSFSNSDIPFTLLNTSSSVLVTLKDSIVVSNEVPTYVNPKEGESWALIDKVWQYTNRPTPGLSNLAMDNVEFEASQTAVTVQPCALNQYRSLETNRCRLLATLGVVVTACKDGQYRSEETNRCRTIATDAKTVTLCSEGEERNPTTQRCRKIITTSEPVSCKVGQERNQDTNRCRTITTMPHADYAVLGAESNQGGNWYVLATIGGILLLALAYAVWEWHDELGKFFRRYYGRFLQFARIRK